MAVGNHRCLKHNICISQGRYELQDRLQAYKVRPAEDVPPHKFETGTKSHEGLAGTTAAINYLADLGTEFGAPFADQYPEFEGRR